MYGKEDIVPRIGDATFTVGYGLSTGQVTTGEVEMVEEWGNDDLFVYF